MLTKCLLRIGESQMDLFVGAYTVEEISKQIQEHLDQNKIHSLTEYQRWLCKEGKEYQLVTLRDKSSWTLRLGESIEKFVHIHPARYSRHTVRVKAVTLKTTILVLALHKLKVISVIDTESVNAVRKKFLKEPPFKSISKAAGLVRLLDLFQTNYGEKIV